MFGRNANEQQPPAEQNANANEQQPPANTGEGKAKGYAYRCKVKCTYNGKLCREGDVIVLPEKKEVPHFELAEKDGEKA